MGSSSRWPCGNGPGSPRDRAMTRACTSSRPNSGRRSWACGRGAGATDRAGPRTSPAPGGCSASAGSRSVDWTCCSSLTCPWEPVCRPRRQWSARACSPPATSSVAPRASRSSPSSRSAPRTSWRACPAGSWTSPPRCAAPAATCSRWIRARSRSSRSPSTHVRPDWRSSSPTPAPSTPSSTAPTPSDGPRARRPPPCSASRPCAT